MQMIANIWSVGIKASHVDANIWSVGIKASHVDANIWSVSTNDSHVSWTNSITPVAKQTPFRSYYIIEQAIGTAQKWRKFKGDQTKRIGCVTARDSGMCSARDSQMPAVLYCFIDSLGRRSTWIIYKHQVRNTK